MERYSSSDSNISLDSLEKEFKNKTTMKKKISNEGVDTILVPFYEKDVLIKVPKGQKSRNINDSSKNKNASNKFKKESTSVNNYLVNKEARKKKHTSYLERFRKQFAPTQPDNKPTENEIRSISPEFGDTERESFGDEVSNNPATDFFNTEAYNEMYYDKLMNNEINNFIEQAYEEQLKFTNDIRGNSPDVDDNNLRSISDVSQPRRNMRRATIQPIPSIRLGGLGPDMENIRPRLERARSLQRYSEKVRMANRVKIYKKSVQEEIEKKEKDSHIKRQQSAKSKEQKGNEKSFLVNKNTSENVSQMNRRCYAKSKSANVKQVRHRDVANDKLTTNTNYYNQNVENNKNVKKLVSPKVEEFDKVRIKSSNTTRSNVEPVKNKVKADVSVPPVQISFLVNMGGLRPSSALRKLEAKHRMYQEKVKEFEIKNDNEVDSDNK